VSMSTPMIAEKVIITHATLPLQHTTKATDLCYTHKIQCIEMYEITINLRSIVCDKTQILK